MPFEQCRETTRDFEAPENRDRGAIHLLDMDMRAGRVSIEEPVLLHLHLRAYG